MYLTYLELFILCSSIDLGTSSLNTHDLTRFEYYVRIQKNNLLDNEIQSNDIPI